jgi:hypothetical protein
MGLPPCETNLALKVGHSKTLKRPNGRKRLVQPASEQLLRTDGSWGEASGSQTSGGPPSLDGSSHWTALDPTTASRAWVVAAGLNQQGYRRRDGLS